MLTVLVATALGAALHGVGAVHNTVLLVVSLPALLAGVWALQAAPDARLWSRSPAMVLLALAAYCAIQTLPIPTTLLAKIAPHNVEVWQQSVRPWNAAARGAVSISLDPGASWVEALKWTAYAAVFIASSRLAMLMRGRTTVLVVFGAALSAAISLILHGLVGAKTLYGVYEPSFGVSTRQLGPLLNSNNLAGYLNLGVFCGLGLLRSRRRSTSTSWLLALGVAILGACVTFTGSRGGVGALVAGAVVFLALELFSRTKRPSSRGRLAQRLPLLGAFVGIMCLVVLGAGPSVWTALAEEGLEKLSLIAKVGALVADCPWLGIGRGAFESAFTAYAHHRTHERFQFAENFLAQWTAEWGIPVTILALSGLLFSLWRSIAASGRSATLRGALVGLIALLLQNLVDLGLEVPAVAMATAALLGSIWGSCQRRHGARRSSKVSGEVSRVPSRVAMVWGGVALAVATVCWNQARVCGSPTLEDDKRETYEAFTHSPTDGRINGATVEAELMRRVARHPAEPLFFQAGGYLAWRMGENALPWLGRAIELSGGSGRSHLLLAMVLADRGITAQALLSLKLAVCAEPSLATTVAPLAIRYALGWDALMSTVPAGRLGADLLVEMARAAKTAEQRELRTKLLRAALSRAANHQGAMLTRANDIIAELGRGTSPSSAQGDCALRPVACGVELGQLAQALTKVGPISNVKLNVYARWLVLDSRAEEADRYLAQRCPATESPRECWRLRTLVVSRYASTELLNHRLETYLTVSCNTSALCASAARFAADLLSARGAHALALSYRMRAATEEPTGQAWIAVARAALQADRAPVARSALSRAQELGALKSDALWQQLLELEGEPSPSVGLVAPSPDHAQ